MEKKDFAFDKTNYILLAVGMAVVVIGFLLMSGAGLNGLDRNHYHCYR